jgi:glutaminyl-tRNA synthetase
MNFIEKKILEEGAEKNLVLRFPPEPNGHLHIGHAKAIILNFDLAKKYDGVCRLRFDDTNPLNENEEYEKSIIEDINWLGYKDFEITRTSDYYDFLVECARNLIIDGLAYMDFSSSEEIANMKGTTTKPGKNSPYRLSTARDNLQSFDNLLVGASNGVLRAKIDMSHPNMFMRDPIIFRKIENTKNNAYPMYDFAHPLSDYKEGVTKSLCSLEFVEHRPLYNWVLEKCIKENKDNHPEQIEFNRLNIKGICLSKREIKKMIDLSLDGWDNPKLFTLKGLKRRGYTPDAIKDFCYRVGWTTRDLESDLDVLHACLKDDLKVKADRLMAVMDPLEIEITNWSECFKGDFIKCRILNNPDNPKSVSRTRLFSKNILIEKDDFRESAGRKFKRLKIGSEVRLKGAYVIKAESCKYDEDGNITKVYCTLDPNSKSGNPLDRKIGATIHWISELEKINATFIDFSNTEKNKINGYITSHALVNNTVQFMRRGYYIKDNKSKENTYFKTIDLR